MPSKDYSLNKDEFSSGDVSQPLDQEVKKRCRMMIANNFYDAVCGLFCCPIGKDRRGILEAKIVEVYSDAFFYTMFHLNTLPAVLYLLFYICCFIFHVYNILQ